MGSKDLHADQEELLITVGEVLAPHGVRGELRIKPETDFPERFAPGTELMVSDPEPRRLRIERARPHKSCLLVAFEEINDRDSAELLRGALLQVPESELVPLSEGEFYRYQLLGVQVFSESGLLIGSVEDILDTGANDVFVVTPAVENRERPFLIPATREVITEMNPEKKHLRIRTLPGLLTT